MMIKKVIISTLIFSLLFINSTSVFANELENDEFEIVDVNSENAFENEIVTNSVGDIDPSQITAQSKPATDLYDDSGTIHQNDEFASYYFSNLTDNFGNNTIGSCGYVATAMMLSYYDTYWNDNVIDDSYDVTTTLLSLSLTHYHDSPGIRREYDYLLTGDVYDKMYKRYSMIKALNTEDYWNLVSDNYSDYFHLYLIKLAEEQFDMYHDYFRVLEAGGIIDATGYPCMSSLVEQKELIEYYLSLRGLQGQFSISYTSEDVRNFTINNVKEGRPVMLLLGSSNGFHFVVAYDLDDKGNNDNSDDDIYAHYGWSSVKNSEGIDQDAQHVNIDTDKFPWLISAMTLNFTNEHSCSNNYTYVEYGETKSKCSCYFPCHPAHEHAYKANNAFTHQYDCGCYANDNNYYNHNFEYVSDGTNTHSLKCKDCEYVASTESHNNQYTRNNTKTHVAECQVCGYVETVEHNFEYTSASDYQHINTCIDCGFTYHDDHDFIYNEIDSGYHTTTCSKCDYTSTDEHDIYTFIEYTQHGDKCHDCGYVDESTLEDHIYSSWIYQNEFNHISTCGVCGAKGTTTGVHAFFTSGIYMICADCGYTKLPGIGGGNIIMSNTKVSLNGSYIMPDGTIMLVDEDIEAYLNGTLVFYNKDNLPVVQ